MPLLSLCGVLGGEAPLSINFRNPLLGGPRHPRRWFPSCAAVSCVCTFCRFPVLGAPLSLGPGLEKKIGPTQAMVANAVWRFGSCAILYFGACHSGPPCHNGTLSGWPFRQCGGFAFSSFFTAFRRLGPPLSLGPGLKKGTQKALGYSWNPFLLITPRRLLRNRDNCAKTWYAPHDEICNRRLAP